MATRFSPYRFSFHWIGFIVGILLLLLMGATRATAFYVDVSQSAWYRGAIETFLSAGYLDGSQARFRPGDNAHRSEFVKLLVEIHGGPVRDLPLTQSFRDVSPEDWFYRSMEEAAQEGWVKGDNNCFGRSYCYARPYAFVNRAEAATLIVRAFGLEATNEAPQFSDNMNALWYARDVQIAADHCVLQGDAGSDRVRPADFMNRAEMVMMLDRARNNLLYGIDCGKKNVVVPRVLSATAIAPDQIDIEFNVDLNPGSVSDTLRYALVNASDVFVVGAQLVNDHAIRLSLSQSLVSNRSYTIAIRNMLTKNGIAFEETATVKGFASSPVIDDGALSIKRSSTLLSSENVPKGAMGVRMLSFDFTASCSENAVIDSIALMRDGQGVRSDISGVYAAQNGKRISRKRAVASSDQMVELRFTRPLNILACQSTTVEIFADFESDATTAGRHSFVLEMPQDVRGSVKKVSGDFPIRGPLVRVGAVKTGMITVAYRSISPNEIDVGDSSAVVGKFQLKVDSAEDQTIHSILLKQEGSVTDGDLTNLRLRRSNGTVLSGVVPRTNGDYALFTLDPGLRVRQGDSVILEVIADVLGGANDAFRFRFEEESDLLAYGSRYGKGENGKLFGSQIVFDTTTTADLLSIQAGRFTVELDGPTTKTYAPDTRDAVLANIHFTPGSEAVDMKNFFVAIQGQAATGGGFQDGSSADDIADVLDGVKIKNMVTGRSVAGQRLSGAGDFSSSASKTYQVYRFDDFIIRGAQSWEFRVNFKDNGRTNHPKAGDRFRIFICAEPTMMCSGEKLASNTVGCDFGGLLSAPSKAYQMRIRGLTTGRDIGDVRPRGTIAGNTHMIESAKLSITVRSIGETDMTVRGAKNIPLLRFEATSGIAKSLFLRSLIFEADAGSLSNAQNYTLWVDDSGDGIVDTVLEKGAAAEGGKVIFRRLSGGGYALADETVLFEVRADVAGSLAGTSLRLRFAQTTASYVDVEEVDDGSSLSGINTNGVCSQKVCDISVSTTASKLWQFLPQGNLFVTQGAGTIRSRQLLGGTLSDPLLRLRFRSQYEDIDVTDIRISTWDSSGNSIERLELMRAGENAAFANATVGACSAQERLLVKTNNDVSIQTYCAKLSSQQFVVPAGQEIDVLVAARIKTDTDGGLSGEPIRLWLSGAASSEQVVAVRARGLRSSATLRLNNGDLVADGEVYIGAQTPGASSNILGSSHEIVMAKIISVANANPDPDGTIVKAGAQPFGQFRFQAAKNSNNRGGENIATLSGVLFSVSATNVSLDASSFYIYNKADPSVKNACTAYASNGIPLVQTVQGAFFVSCSGLASSSVNSVLESGGDMVLVLEGTIVNPQVSAGGGVSLEAALDAFSSQQKAENGYGISASHIHWIDEDGSGKRNVFWIDYPQTSVRSTGYRI